MISTPGNALTVQALTAASADETCGPWIDVRGYTHLTFYCASAGTTSSGVISFEEAAPATVTAPAFPAGLAEGKYSVITTKNASDFSGDAQVAVHLSVASYGWVRARVSTAIGGGGTVSIVLVGA